jgi:hypothetical protein
MKKKFTHEQDLNGLFLCRAKDKISTELDGETVILDISSGVYSGLDPVGTTIWNCLEQPISFHAIVKSVLENYNVSQEQCTSDTLEFLNSLLDNGLIVVSDAKDS